MQRQRQEERESFQQAQRQYSSLPRYGNCLKSYSVYMSLEVNSLWKENVVLSADTVV